MKKLFPIALIALFAALTVLPSCSKSDSTNYTCTCTFKSPLSGNDTTIKNNEGSNKTTAQQACDSAKTGLLYFDSSAACHL